MLRLRAIGYWTVVLLVISCVSGCFRGETHVDEEQDPHFLRGRNLVSSQDFKGAAAEFEKALETNPDSAAAHFELGWLYDTKLNDYAAAIYHYERHLQLQPQSERAALVKDRIRGCKQELANSEFPLPQSRNLQKEVDRLNAENLMLKQQLDALKNQLTAATAAAAQARVETVRYAATVPEVSQSETSPPPAAPRERPRVHVVKAHETISSIAAEYGMRPATLLAANPQTNPRRLRVGQSLVLP
jgi:tetratricopeptide (TPR) repeat protein